MTTIKITPSISSELSPPKVPAETGTELKLFVFRFTECVVERRVLVLFLDGVSKFEEEE